MTDDYDEAKALEEATSKGFAAGDPVGDLTDPTLHPSADASKNDAHHALASSNTGLGLYRAGGPTTIFGGSGWGPYSDGPLNAVRKSLLNRDGLTEENFMHVAAIRTGEAGEEFARLRKEAGRVWGGLGLGGMGMEVLPIEEDLKRRAVEWLEGDDGIAVEDEEGETKKRKRNVGDELPVGVYEPHSGIVQCQYCPCVFYHTYTHAFGIQTAETRSQRRAVGKSYQIPLNDACLAARSQGTAVGRWHGSIPY